MKRETMPGPILIGLLAQAFGAAAGFIICGAVGLFSRGLVTEKKVRS